jgi:hypothetical protein
MATFAGYAIALGALVAVSAAAMLRDRALGVRLLIAAAIFGVSLAARQLDSPWCPIIPIGTHWLWHVLNGAVIAMVLHAAIAHRSRQHAGRDAPTIGLTASP